MKKNYKIIVLWLFLAMGLQACGSSSNGGVVQESNKQSDSQSPTNDGSTGGQSDSSSEGVNQSPRFSLQAAALSAVSGVNYANPQFAYNITDSDTDRQNLHFAVSNSHPQLFQEQPSVSFPSGTLRFLAKAGAQADVELRIQLIDESSGSRSNVVTRTLRLSMPYVNSAPSFDLQGNVTGVAGAEYSQRGYASNFDDGNGGTQNLHFEVENSRPNVFKSQPWVSYSSGTLRFETLPNARGDVELRIQLVDDGGTLNGGVDRSAVVTRTLSIQAPEPNRDPSFSGGPDVTAVPGETVALRGWAARIDDGDGNTQRMWFEVSSNQPDWFTEQPRVSVPSGTLRFTSREDAKGITQVSVTLRDSGGTANGGVDRSMTFVFNLTLKPKDQPTNSAPVAQDLDVTVAHNTETQIQLVGSDSDGDTLTFELLNTPQNGVVSLDGSQVVYTPHMGFSGSDQFRYVANDGKVESASASVNITVEAAANHPPTAEGQSVELERGSSIEVELVAQDIDGDSLSFEISEAPRYGTATLDGNKLTYTPNADFTGEDFLKFIARDQESASEAASVVFTVKPVNQAPSIEGAEIAVAADQASTQSAEASDPDNDELSLSVSTAPSNGSVSIDGLQYTYTPNAGFIGQDRFTLTISDGELSASAEIIVNVAQNNPPVLDVTLQPREGSSVASRQLWLAGTAVDEDLAYVSVEVNGQGGDNAELNEQNFIAKAQLSPGNNVVRVIAVDEAGNRSEKSFNVYFGHRVAAGNSHTAALIDGAFYSWGRNNKGQIGNGGTSELADNADGDASTSHPTQPVKVDLSTLDGGQPVEFVSLYWNQNSSSALDTNGRVWSFGDNRDGRLGLGTIGGDDVLTPTKIGTLSDIVAIARGYDHGLALDASGQVWAYGDNSDGQLGNGTIDDNGTPQLVQGIANAVQIAGGSKSTVVLDAEGQVWTIGRNRYGNLGQGTEDRDDHTQAVQVPLPEAIVAIATGRDHVLARTLDGKVYAWGLNSSSQVGLEETWGSPITSPRLLPWFGPEQSLQAVNVFANGNQSYVEAQDGKLYPWGQNTTGTLGVPQEGDVIQPADSVLSVENLSDFAAGALHAIAIRNDDALFTWGWNFEASLGAGPDAINRWGYRSPLSIDLAGGSGTNLAPELSLAAVTLQSGASVDITLAGTDPNVGDTLSYSIETAPSNGSASINGDTLTYTANAGFVGSDELVVAVSDGDLRGLATLNITVEAGAVNQAPSITGGSLSVAQGDSVSQTADASDPDGDSLTLSVSTAPANGSVSISDLQFTYTPDAGFVGQDSFSLSVSDGELSAQADYTVTVSASNQAPTLSLSAQSVDAGESLTLTLDGSDPDGDALSYSIAQPPQSGTASISGDQLSYTSNNGFSGSDSLQVTASDGALQSDPATLSITVNAALPPFSEWPASGGDATIAFDESRPFLQFIPSLDATHLSEASIGRELFVAPWEPGVTSRPNLDGLGPLFITNACANCHLPAARANSYAELGRVDVGLLFRLGHPDGSLDPTFGNQLQTAATTGQAEGQVTWSVDGNGKPVFTFQQESAALGEDIALMARLAPQLVGMGLLEQLSDATILERADPNDSDGDGISGRPHWLDEAQTKLGRYGWKATEQTLKSQSSAAFNGDMGLTTPLHPDENCTAVQSVCAEAPNSGNPEVSQAGLDAVSDFLSALAVPARRDNGDPEKFVAGATLFNRIGCADCHRPSMTTAEGGRYPQLGGQEIFAYTDLLLHDMGSDLSEPAPTGDASGSEWRTPPLWSIGLVESNPQSRFLHDGRATTIEEAITWHGGEALSARQQFQALNTEERDALLHFLRGL